MVWFLRYLYLTKFVQDLWGEMGNGRQRGMSLEELRGLDPEAVVAQCGGSHSADDGPNPGVAGEQEAIVADDTQLPEGSEPSADGEVDTSAGPRRIRLNAGTLVERLMAADPSLDQSSGLKLLEQILNESRIESDKLPTVVRGLGQFVPESLSADVDAYIDEHASDHQDDASPAPFDQDAVDAPDPTGLIESELEGGESSPVSVSGLDQYREALRPLLVEAVQVWRRSGEDAADPAILDLANAFWDQGLLFYAALGASDVEAQQYLLQLTKEQQEEQGRRFVPLEELKQDPDKRALAWYYRIARRSTALVCRGGKSIDESLADFDDWPGEKHLRRKLKRLQAEAQQRAARSQARMQVDEPPAGEADAEPKPDAPEADAIEAGLSPIVVEDVDGRRVVRFGDLPRRSSHSVTGGGAKMKPPAKSAVQAPSQSQVVDDQKTDQQLIEELTMDVFREYLQAVLADDDPEEAWMSRDSEDISREAQRRYLQARRTVQAV